MFAYSIYIIPFTSVKTTSVVETHCLLTTRERERVMIPPLPQDWKRQ